MAFVVHGTSPEYTVALCVEKGWAVRLACGACGREPILWHRAELERLPSAATLEEIAERANCSGCGLRDGRLSTRQGGWLAGERNTAVLSDMPRRPG